MNDILDSGYWNDDGFVRDTGNWNDGTTSMTNIDLTTASTGGTSIGEVAILAESLTISNPGDNQDAYVYFGAEPAPEVATYFFELTSTNNDGIVSVQVPLGTSNQLGSYGSNITSGWRILQQTSTGNYASGGRLTAVGTNIGAEVPISADTKYYVEARVSEDSLTVIVRTGSHGSSNIIGTSTCTVAGGPFTYLYTYQANGTSLATGNFTTLTLENYSFTTPFSGSGTEYDILNTIKSVIDIGDPVQVISDPKNSLDFLMAWGELPPEGGIEANPGSIYYCMGDRTSFKGSLYVKTIGGGTADGWCRLVDVCSSDPFLQIQSYLVNQTPTGGSSFTLDVTGGSGEQVVVLEHNLTSGFDITGLTQGQYVAIEFVQDTTGNRTISSWGSIGGTPPTLAPNPGDITLAIIRGFSDGSVRFI